MAAGCNYLNYERLHDICCCSSGLHDFLRREKLLLDFHGPCLCCSDGFVNISQDKSAVDCYVCSNKAQHHASRSILSLACRQLLSVPLYTKPSLYVPYIYLHQRNITVLTSILSLSYPLLYYYWVILNAHSHLWGCSKTNIRGKLVEDQLLKHSRSLLNDGSATYLHPATGCLSAIDISISDPSIYLDFMWEVLPDNNINKLYKHSCTWYL